MIKYDRKKAWWVRLAFWCAQLPVLGILYMTHASVEGLVWYGLLISVLTGIEACLPSEEVGQ